LADQQLTLAEERDLIKRLGPTAMRAILAERGGVPARMARATIISVSWANGEVSLQEFGDTAVKTNVRWLPPYYPGVFDAVWYLKFGDDGIVLGPTVGDYDEWANPDYAAAQEATVTATATTTASTYSTPSGGPSLDLWVEIGEPIEVRVEGVASASLAGAVGALFSWRALDGGTPAYGDLDADGIETGSLEWVPGSRTTLWKPTFGGNATLEFRIRCIGAHTTSVKNRRIAYKRVRGYA
jgi:hypothetical protein